MYSFHGQATRCPSHAPFAAPYPPPRPDTVLDRALHYALVSTCEPAYRSNFAKKRKFRKYMKVRKNKTKSENETKGVAADENDTHLKMARLLNA